MTLPLGTSKQNLLEFRTPNSSRPRNYLLSRRHSTGFELIGNGNVWRLMLRNRWAVAATYIRTLGIPHVDTLLVARKKPPPPLASRQIQIHLQIQVLCDNFKFLKPTYEPPPATSCHLVTHQASSKSGGQMQQASEAAGAGGRWPMANGDLWPEPKRARRRLSS